MFRRGVRPTPTATLVNMRNAKASGIGAVYSQLRTVAASVQEAVNPIVLKAAGDRLLNEASPQWVQWATRAYIAESVALQETPVNTPSIAVVRRARAQGEMVAFWRTAPSDLAEVTRLQQDLTTTLRAALIRHWRADLLSAVRHVINSVRSEENIHRTVENTCVPYLPWRHLVVPRCHTMFETFAYVIPSTSFEDPWNNIWIQLCSQFTGDAEEFVVIPEGQPNWVADIDARIAEWGGETVLGAYELLSWYKRNDAEMYVIAAAITSVTVLCKGNNLTTKWLDRHLQQFQAAFNINDFRDAYTQESITTFHRMYPVDDIPPEQLYKFLCSISAQLNDEVTKPLRWMLEQTAAANLTPITAFASAFLKGRHINMNLLKRGGVTIPEHEFHAFAIAILKMANAPYSSILKPPIPSSDYADIAYLGLRVARIAEGDSTYNAYMGAWDNHLRCNKASLDSFAKTIAEYITEVPDAAKALVREWQKTHDVPLKLDGDYVYLCPTDDQPLPPGLYIEGSIDIPRVAVPAPAQDAPPEAAQVDGGEGQPPAAVAPAPPVVQPIQNPFLQPAPAQAAEADLAEIREVAAAERAAMRQAVQAARMAWPKALKGLPARAGRVLIHDLIEHAAGDQADKFTDGMYKLIECADSVSQQQALPEVDYVNGRVPRMYRTVPDTIIQAAKDVGVTEQEVAAALHAAGDVDFDAANNTEYVMQRRLVRVPHVNALAPVYRQVTRSMATMYSTRAGGAEDPANIEAAAVNHAAQNHETYRTQRVESALHNVDAPAAPDQFVEVEIDWQTNLRDPIQNLPLAPQQPPQGDGNAGGDGEVDGPQHGDNDVGDNNDVVA